MLKMPYYTFLLSDITPALIHCCVCMLNTYTCCLILPLLQSNFYWRSRFYWSRFYWIKKKQFGILKVIVSLRPTSWSLDSVTLLNVVGRDPDPSLQIHFLSPQICLMIRGLGWIWLPPLGLPCSPHLAWYYVAGSWLTRILLWWLCFCAWLLAPWPFRSRWLPLHPDNPVLKRYSVFDFLLWFKTKPHYQLLRSHLAWEFLQSPLPLCMKDSYLNPFV